MNALTNSDISAKIRSFREIKDPCDRAIALAQFESEYKQSEFYKLTKRPLQTLYYEIAVEDLLTLRTLLDNLKELIESLDADKIIAVFDEVNAKTLNTMKDSLAGLESSDLMGLLHGIKR